MKKELQRSFIKTTIGLTALVTAPYPSLKVEAKSYKTSDFKKDKGDVLLARMIYGEARNCAPIEQIAVAYTAVNRANDGKKWNGETVKEAILKPWQYSCFNNNDPNKKRLYDPKNKKAFRQSLDIARKVLSKKVKDPTKGATHYFNPKVIKPKWAKKMKKIGKIKTKKGLSKHEFYKEN